MVDFTGGGLGILIDCEFRPGHNWMAFAACYSIYKNLPDAQAVILLRRGVSIFNLFGWCYRFGVPLFQHSGNLRESELLTNFEKVVKIPPTVMAVRGYGEFGDLVGPLSVKSDEFPTFVDYSAGCGRFVLADWIDRVEGPFRGANRFATNELTPNEKKVLALWQQMALTYDEAKR